MSGLIWTSGVLQRCRYYLVYLMQLIRAVAAYYLPPGGHRGNTIHVPSFVANGQAIL